MEKALTLTDVSKTYHEAGRRSVVVFEKLTIEIYQGEFFVFLGPSGCGKSTLLRIMSGLETNFSGKVALGQGLTRQDTSFVFQQFALLPWLTVWQNIELGLVGRKLSPTARAAKVKEELELLNLAKFSYAYPRELSGGMRQRVGIARALATDPKIIFMDEPFSELDSFTAAGLRRELLSIWKKNRPTIVMVTHNIAEALELADRIAVLTMLPARIEEVVTNSLPRPRAMRAKDFFSLEDRLYKLVSP